MSAPIPKAKKRKKPPKRNWSTQADRLCGQIVRARGECQAVGPHAGALQWAHGFSRSYRAVRWDQRNGFALCQGHHFWFTHHPLEWDEWLHVAWGDELYAEMRALALSSVRPDLQVLVADLRAEASTL